MTSTDVLPTLSTARPGWRGRVCARLRGVCALLRAAHCARIPF